MRVMAPYRCGRIIEHFTVHIIDYFQTRYYKEAAWGGRRQSGKQL